MPSFNWIQQDRKEIFMANVIPGSTYTIQQGDSLFSIAQQAYGDGNQWQKIYDANKQVIGDDPNLIRPGELLLIPALGPTPGSNYTVEPGDSLFSIAQLAYGDSNQWQKIYDANKQVIGNDPNLIRPGEVLYIPPITPPKPKTCKVTAANGLNVRAEPTSQSALIASYTAGTVLNYIAVVVGENVAGNPRWGRSEQGHYFWMGGTDHPNG
jgi:LysM repeat protein